MPVFLFQPHVSFIETTPPLTGEVSMNTLIAEQSPQRAPYVARSPGGTPIMDATSILNEGDDGRFVSPSRMQEGFSVSTRTPTLPRTASCSFRRPSTNFERLPASFASSLDASRSSTSCVRMLVAFFRTTTRYLSLCRDSERIGETQRQDGTVSF
jgi:hypothetical protein